MARSVDLDAAHRAKAEEQGEPNVLTLGGREFKLVSAAPAAFLVGLGRIGKGQLGGLEDALRSILFDPTEMDDLLALGLDLTDLEPIASAIYGVDLGEAPASG